MHSSTLLEMAADGFGDRVAFGTAGQGLTYAALMDRARRAGAWATARGVGRVGMVDVNSEAVPILLYGSGLAGVPFVPINYRLADEQLRAILSRIAPAVVVVSDEVVDRVGDLEGIDLVTRTTFLAELDNAPVPDQPAAGFGSPDDIAILLFTSGTTGEPKAAVLRHKHLTSYIINTVEFMGADEDEAALVSVPPYHVAGTSAVLSSVYSGRRVVYLSAFTPEAWVAAAADQSRDPGHGRPHDARPGTGYPRRRAASAFPRLRHLSYGGGKMPLAVIERALRLLPHVDFVNAYGLTETSSTIAVLNPEDHRRAIASSDPDVRRRLRSVGRPLPSLDVEIRDPNGKPVAPGELGEIWVRGEQVAGEYLGRADTRLDGWFPTRDSGVLGPDGYLYLESRLDDVIVRGGENMSPGEIEEVLVAHPAVSDAAVVGIPDVEWGEKVVAAVILCRGVTRHRDGAAGLGS